MSEIPTTGTLKFVIQMPESTGGGNTVDGSAPNPASPQQETNTSNNPVSGDKYGGVKMAVAFQAVKTLGIQGVNAAISNIGLATGNYYMQQRLENGAQAVTSIVSLAVSAAAGSVAFATTLAGMAISAGADNYARHRAREIANYEAAQYAKKLGYSEARK